MVVGLKCGVSTSQRSRTVCLAKSLGGMLALLFVLALSGWQSTAKAELIYDYNFNGTFAPSSGTKQSSSFFTFSFSGVGINPGGTTVNAQNGDPAGGYLFMAGPLDDGKFIRFNSDGTAGYSNLIFSFAGTNGGSDSSTTTSSNISVNGFDGTNTFSVPFVVSPGDYNLYTADFSSFTSLNNNANTYFQLVFSGAPGRSLVRLDNITLSGTLAVTATPEPETWAMMALGVLALGVFSWKRKRTAPTLVPALG